MGTSKEGLAEREEEEKVEDEDLRPAIPHYDPKVKPVSPIPVGNLVLLRDHPKGRCKIQDRNKLELFKVIRQGE